MSASVWVCLVRGEEGKGGKRKECVRKKGSFELTISWTMLDYVDTDFECWKVSGCDDRGEGGGCKDCGKCGKEGNM